MSTKCTIAYSHGPDFDFHFYHEVFDDHGVYLELTGESLQYEAGPGRVMVRIPVEIWEVIRHRAPADLQYAEWTDQQVDAYVEQAVDQQIRDYQEHLEKTGQEKSNFRIAGSLAFGFADEPREQQIEEGRQYYRQLRDEQTERKRRIERLLAEQRSPAPAVSP
jgi:hypothetical protein